MTEPEATLVDPDALGRPVIDGKYELHEPLGQGGMAVVFRATDIRLDRQVAVKIVYLEGSLKERTWRSFSREARSMAKLHHPHVIEIYDVGQQADFSYLVMPYHQGTDLAGWVSAHRGPPVALEPALQVLSQVCEGLHALHQHGVVHGDIKPSNILISDHLHVRVADLGMARHVDDPGAHASTGGTVGFMAPELLSTHDDPAHVHKADVYGLGVTAYWLLTGAMPLGEDDIIDVLVRQKKGEIAPPSTLNRQLPAAFDEPLLRALDPRPAERPSALAFRDALFAAQRSTHLPPIHHRPLVVIVDDDPNALMLIEEIVRSAVPEVEIITHDDPSEALSTLAQRCPSLVITDLHMPRLSGTQIVSSLRERPEHHEVPIFVLTGVGSAHDWQELSRLGADRFLVKPIAEDVLHDMVLRALCAPSMRRT